jgi:hypothetical protein
LILAAQELLENDEREESKSGEEETCAEDTDNIDI